MTAPKASFAYELPTLEQRVCEIADLHKVSCETLINILDGEHYGKEWRDGSQNKVVSKTGDYGLAQINLEWWKDISKEEALNPDFAINFMAGEIAKGNEHYWTNCSCVSYIRARGYDLPRIKNPSELLPNTTPSKGVLALFNYKGVHHIAEVIGVSEIGFMVREANFEKCKRTERFIMWDSPSLRGFYQPVKSG